MTFGDALEYLKAGRIARRKGWLENDRVACFYTADMRPYLVVWYEDNEPIPYTATDIDLFADDWEVMRE